MLRRQRKKQRLEQIDDILEAIDELLSRGIVVWMTPTKSIRDEASNIIQVTLRFLEPLEGRYGGNYQLVELAHMLGRPESLSQVGAVLRKYREQILADDYVLEPDIKPEEFIELAKRLFYESPESKPRETAAAVLVGGVLEQHVIRLCGKHRVETTKKNKPDEIRSFEDLVSELRVKRGVFNAEREKQIKSWYAFRNSAAHGRYKEYNRAQIEGFVSGLPDFIRECPA